MSGDTRLERAAAPAERPRADVRRPQLRRLAATATPYLYLAPMVVLVGVFLLYPAADTIWLSFNNWDGIHVPQFVGVANFFKLGTDPAFVTACLNTVYWVAGLMLLQVALGLGLAMLLNASPLGELYKRVLYLPATISGAAIGVIWYAIFNNEQGLLNGGLRLLHLDVLAHAWLTTPPLNTFAMVVAAVWQGLGPAIVLFLVGLQNIPRDPLEAGRVDGA